MSLDAPGKLLSPLLAQEDGVRDRRTHPAEHLKWTTATSATINRLTRCSENLGLAPCVCTKYRWSAEQS
jgi:hypothetical protein